MRFGFDCDGVLYNFTDGFRRSVPVELHGPDPQVYGIHKAWNMDHDVFLDHVKRGIEERILFWTGEPLPGALATVNGLKQAGHEILIITHRGVLGEGPEVAREATAHWLDSNGFMYDEIYLAEDKTSVPTDAMVEDKIENFLALEAAGVDAYLIDQAWNRHLDTDKRIHHLSEFAERALAAYEAK